MRFSILPSKGYIVTCSLSEDIIHQKLNNAFNKIYTKQLLAMYNYTSYLSGKGEFTIDKVVQTRNGDSRIVGHGTIHKDPEGETTISIDYYSYDDHTNFFLIIWLCLCLVFWMIIFCGILKTAFYPEMILAFFLMLGFTSVPFIIRIIYAESIAALHRHLIRVLKKD